MAKEFSYYIDLSQVELSEGQKTAWLHAMPVGKPKHPVYGEMDFSPQALAAYANSVKSRTLGTVDPVVDYDHMKFDGIAAGWVKDAEVRLSGSAGDGLQLLVEWTDEAAKRIRNKEYRYFSATFDQEWESPEGKQFSNVIFGGAITNRPYLKNLVPLNLSELSFDAPNPAPDDKGEVEVDIKKLAKALGLSEDAGEEAVYKKLGELATPPAPPTPPTPPEPIKLFDFDDETVKKLAETNPAVKAMIDTMTALVANNREQSKELMETAVTMKLNALDNSKVVFTPAAKDLAHDIAMQLDSAHREKLFELLTRMRDNNAVLVELGERGKTGAAYVRDLSAEAKFSEAVAKVLSDNDKMSPIDAMEYVARENPSLYTAYRGEMYTAKTA